MGDDESPGLLSRAWNWIKTVACSIVCAWKEILVWILVWVLIIAFSYLVYLILTSFVVEVLLTGVVGPLAWVINIVIIIVIFIVIILIALLISLLHDWVWQQLKTKWWACWQAC